MGVLGLVKHVATVQLGYFGETFGRPSDRELPWMQENAEPDSDMWVPANESRQEIIEFHHYSARHAGHADIIRELIDGTAGMKANDPNMPARNSEEWAAYRYRIEEAARTADLQRY